MPHDLSCIWNKKTAELIEIENRLVIARRRREWVGKWVKESKGANCQL